MVSSKKKKKKFNRASNMQIYSHEKSKAHKLKVFSSREDALPQENAWEIGWVIKGTWK